MSTEIYKKRQENLKSVLGEKGLDGILITNLTNIRYISGFTGSAASCLVTPSGQYFITPINASNYQINYPKPTEFNTSSVNFKSFAKVVLSDVRTFSGDVYRVAAYVKNNGPFGNWTKVIDTPVEAPELLSDTFSLTGTTRIGYFASDSVLSTYWNSTAGSTSNPFAVSTTHQTFSEDEYLVDSVFMSSSAANMLDNQDDHHVLELKSNYYIKIHLL